LKRIYLKASNIDADLNFIDWLYKFPFIIALLLVFSCVEAYENPADFLFRIPSIYCSSTHLAKSVRPRFC